MINVRGLANAAIQSVNPNIDAVYIASTGYTVGAAGDQTPTYAAPADVKIQAQAVKGSNLEHIANLNLQSVYKNVRMRGNAQGVVRPEAKGGDLMRFPNVPGGPVRVWKVEAVLETWPEWCSVIVVMQTDTVGA